METNKRRAFILNLLIFILSAFSVLWMMSGVQLYGTYSSLSAARLAALKYFTVDSNILMGLLSLAACFMLKKCRSTSLPASYYVMKLIGTAAVSLTMLVTVFFLAPTAQYGWLSLFTNSNFFMHLLNPLLAIVTFIAFERSRAMKLWHTLTGMIPMLVYAVYYLLNALPHAAADGSVPPAYDWYGFLAFGGAKTFPLVIAIVSLVMYLISLSLWRAARSKQ